jgi:hypothetical protein
MKQRVFIPNVDKLRYFIFPKMKLSVGPLFFARSLGRGVEKVVSNGSYGLVDTGKKKLLVTCQHVVEGFRDEFKNDPKLKLWACLSEHHTIAIDLKYLIAEDKQRDLATFDMESMLSDCEGKEFFRLVCDRVHKVKEGDILLVTGYPVRNKRETDEAVFWGTSPHAFIVKDVSYNFFTANTSRVMGLDRKLLSEEHKNPYGGISGSPCFWTKDFEKIELVAFVSEYLQPALKFAPAKYLNPDGTIIPKEPYIA